MCWGLCISPFDGQSNFWYGPVRHPSNDLFFLPSSSDSGIFSEMSRAAQLSSAAYTGCLGTAFDVTITKQINDVVTDTQVGIEIHYCRRNYCKAC